MSAERTRPTRLHYGAAKRLARDDDPAVRRALAELQDVQPEILYYLLEDPAPEVRRAVARNSAAPHQTDLAPARDADDGVRSELAEKLSRLAPDLMPDEHDKLTRIVVETLEVLAQDQAVRVRRMLAEALRDVAHAPPEVIRRLARDAELSVCAPVLEFSPVLSDEDLLEIIASEPVQGALGAISRRSAVGASVADAVVGSGDEQAITELLANGGAQIREETLDIIIELAPLIHAWHAPLVSRPKLPGRAACRIAQFIAHSLVEELRRRDDLDRETLSAVAKLVDQRLREEADAAKPQNPAADGKFDPSWEDHEDPHERVAELARSGRLDEETICEALAMGDRRFVAAALAFLGGVAEEMVSKAASLSSAKGIVALTWKAGLSMHLAVQLQLQFARVAPDTLLRPVADDGFPMSRKQLDWELEFLSSMGA